MWTVFKWVPRTLSGFLALVGDPFLLGRYYIYMQFIFSSNYMSVEPTHGVYQPTGSPAPDLSWGDLLSIAYLSLTGGSNGKLYNNSAEAVYQLYQYDTNPRQPARCTD